jgi:SAM-dependent methyltransferase
MQNRPTIQECPVCKGRSAFQAFGSPPRPAARCPGCGALERHRLLWLYLNDGILATRTNPYRVLHCAPERCLSQNLRHLPGVEYLSIDLTPQNGAVRMDLTDLWFRDKLFDLVICNHVLEHIPDDRKAMRELLRVCKVGGIGLLNVPFDPRRADTYEDWSVWMPEERRKVFGQHDHVRIYSPENYSRRLSDSGWSVTSLQYVEQFSASDRSRFSLPRGCDQTIYRCDRER